MTPPPVLCRECHRSHRHAPDCARRTFHGRHAVTVVDTVSPDSHLDEQMAYEPGVTLDDVIDVLKAETFADAIDLAGQLERGAELPLPGRDMEEIVFGTPASLPEPPEWTS